MLHPITIRFDLAQFSALSEAAKAQGISVAEVIRQRVSKPDGDTADLLALLINESGEHRQQIADVQATLSTILVALETLANSTLLEHKKTPTGEAWPTWINRQFYIEADNNNPDARSHRLWRQFEAETGNEAPAQFRSSPPIR